MHWQRVYTVVGVHAEGEYAKVVTGGLVDVPGQTMFDKMRHLRDHADGLRKFLLYEPRGAAVHSANLVLPSHHPEAALGYIIMESEEYPPMSGSNTIATVTVVLETGILPMREPVTRLTLETPAGLIDLTCQCRGGRVLQVKFRNVPAFACHLDAVVEVPELGAVTVDVAWGGMFYVLTEAAPFGLALTPDEGGDIVRIGEMVKAATREQLPVSHPENPAIEGPTIAQLWGPPTRPDASG